MKIVVFGASGGTGLELVRQGRARGHEITAFVRNPATFDERDEVRVVQGDVTDADAVTSAIEGQDAVLSALGARDLKTDDLLERASANIMAGMRAHDVKRLIVLGASGALRDASKHQTRLRKVLFWVLRNGLLKHPMRDSAAQQRAIEASDTEYTVVLPPRLTHGPRTGRYRVAMDGLPPRGSSIARADVADFMLSALADGTYLREAPYIAS